MKTIQSFLSALASFLKLDEASLLAAERRREEAYLAGASDIYELEARQRAWDKRTRVAFPV